MPTDTPPDPAAPAGPLARGGATLANWREAPHSLWAFHHVRELVPSALIPAGQAAKPLGKARDTSDLAGRFEGAGLPFEGVLGEGQTTALVMLHRGSLVFEDYRLGYDGALPHLLFSVSKSLTGLLAGVLIDEGRLAPGDAVTAHLPEVAGSAYDGATVGHVLDMTVSTGFEESYLDRSGDYVRYRISTGWNPPGDPGGDSQGPEDLRSFLATMRPDAAAHGHAFHYISPNSDLLGWLLESVAGQPLAELMADRIWRQLGAEADAEITVDRLGAPRTAGGISVRPRDLARVGEMVRQGGRIDGQQLVPADWIAHLFAHDDDDEAHGTWARGDMAELFPGGSYRAQWYRTGLPSGAITAIGIHGQWLWIDPAAELVIAKCSAQDLPIDDALDQRIIALFDGIGRWFEAGGRP